MPDDRPDRDRALDALARLAPWRAEDREQHYRIGMALKSVADDLYAAWLDWSRQAPNFSEAYCRASWRSFKPGGPVTLGTLLHAAREDGGAPASEHAARLANLQRSRVKPPPEAEHDDRDWAPVADALRVGPDQVALLARDLGVSADALLALGVGWFPGQHAGIRLRRDLPVDACGGWTFPMLDGPPTAGGRVCGLRLRLTDDRAVAAYGGANKIALPGSHAGIFAAEGGGGGDLLAVCEGPTDLAALLTLGFDGVGRPSNTGGTDAIRAWVAAHQPAGVAIFIDRDPPGSPAAASTLRGARALRQSLAKAGREVRIVRPPAGTKDVRQWVQGGASREDVERAIAEAEPVIGPRHDWMRERGRAA